jgi:heme-degrading monooxygenase HmoA
MRRPPFALAPLLCWFVFACTPASPFSGPGYDPDRGLLSDAPGPFLAVVTHTAVKPGQDDAFDTHVDAIEAQLEAAPGFVGSSLRGEVFGRERWTLTVWTSEAALGAFYGSGAHARAMQDTAAVVEGVYSAGWELQPEALPPSWDEALEALEAVEPVEPF